MTLGLVLLALWLSEALPSPEGDDGLDLPREGLSDAEDIAGVNNRKDKFIALLQITPYECDTSDGLSGTCFASGICKLNGVSSGSCAKGFGTCCLVQKTCDTTSSFDNTYFINPSYPNSDTTSGVCSISISRASSNICQMRLDFVNLELAQPDSDGNCNTDFLTVSGGTSTPPTICGTNSGQHMYVDVDPNSTGALKVTVDRSTTTVSRKWNIKVKQIPCTSTERAPSGCLQYYTETSGNVQSFNFQSSITQGTPQIASQSYGVCINMATGYCGVIWERNTTSGNRGFTVSSNAAAVNPAIIGTPDAAAYDTTCTTDYVIIPGGVDNLGEAHDRYCGLGFPQMVTTTEKPFVMYVVTDANETPDKPNGAVGTNSGFSLNYRQTTTC
ncbi:uncharacterized protein [Palaemon carinicauda]|uniref:uncharacterized protein n=1 Tax=Palaemon carinicauda TaxID=392227 RepID=UPI0035B650B4